MFHGLIVHLSWTAESGGIAVAMSVLERPPGMCSAMCEVLFAGQRSAILHPGDASPSLFQQALSQTGITT